MNITPDNITKLAPGEIFVFGSNFAGKHGRGAALTAVRKFGAKMGQGTGLMGQSYGIATKDRNIQTLPLDKIEIQVAKFLRFAAANPKLTFFVTAIGTGLAGYKAADIAPLFSVYEFSNNVYLPKEFWSYLS